MTNGSIESIFGKRKNLISTPIMPDVYLDKTFRVVDGELIKFMNDDANINDKSEEEETEDEANDSSVLEEEKFIDEEIAEELPALAEEKWNKPLKSQNLKSSQKKKTQGFYFESKDFESMESDKRLKSKIINTLFFKISNSNSLTFSFKPKLPNI
jgi:hypothetical protein